MKLQGVLDFSLGNFLCLRGYAPMGLLRDISEPDPSFQRDLIHEHKEEMVAFLDEGEFLFFPEVILCATLSSDEINFSTADSLREAIRQGEKVSSTRFSDFRISSSVKTSRNYQDSRILDSFSSATLDISANARKFSRIDGNHRLSVVPAEPKPGEATPENLRFRRFQTPFCLIFFRTPDEAARFSRALFHNINYKQEPLTKEQNLKLILEDESIFTNEDLKTKPSFGWPYYLARKLQTGLDYELVPYLEAFIEPEPRSFWLKQFTFLIEKGALRANESAKTELKNALSPINAILATQVEIRESKNRGLLEALLWFQLTNSQALPLFLEWVLRNHLYLIEKSNGVDLIQIFEKIMVSRGRSIFVSMPFGKTKTDGHYAVIERVCRDLSAAHNLNPPLKAERVDQSTDGTSFDINSKILQLMESCGLLLGNLTYARPNVYHEIGWVMGKNRSFGIEPEIILFLDTSVSETERAVGFNLSHLQRIEFGDGQNESVFEPQLRERIKKVFQLD